MKNIIVFLVLFLVSFESYAADNCGLDRLHSQQDILDAQKCLDFHIKELTDAVDNQAEIGEELIEQHRILVEDQALCKKYDEYYKNARKNKSKYRGVAVDCYNFLTKRAKNVGVIKSKVAQAKDQIAEIEELKVILQGQAALLKNNTDIILNP